MQVDAAGNMVMIFALKNDIIHYRRVADKSKCMLDVF